MYCLYAWAASLPVFLQVCLGICLSLAVIVVAMGAFIFICELLLVGHREVRHPPRGFGR